MCGRYFPPVAIQWAKHTGQWAIPKKKQTGGVEDAFFEKSPEFLGFLLYPWKFQTKASTLEILEIRTFIILEILRPKTKNPGNSTLFFLITLGNSILFLINS